MITAIVVEAWSRKAAYGNARSPLLPCPMRRPSRETHDVSHKTSPCPGPGPRLRQFIFMGSFTTLSAASESKNLDLKLCVLSASHGSTKRLQTSSGHPRRPTNQTPQHKSMRHEQPLALRLSRAHRRKTEQTKTAPPTATVNCSVKVFRLLVRHGASDTTI
jgi:hypothetical protein